MEIWVNGHIQPLNDSAVAARDRGFLYGEAVYEGIKIVNRRPLFLARHLQRLGRSASFLDLAVVWDADSIRPILGQLLDRFGSHDCMARLFLTSGAKGGGPTALVWVDQIPKYSMPDSGPWALVAHNEPLVPYLPAVKHTNRLSHARARRRARARGADDALLIHADGWALEGTASNLFFFEADTLHTPEIGCGILGGITREVVLELAPKSGFRVVEGRYPLPIVTAADECFLTFTSVGLKPVAAIDEWPFPPPVPGPRTERLRDAYEARVAEELSTTPAV